MDFLFKGLLAGFIIAVPLGPVSVLCFRRVLTERRLAGLATVFGAATADMIYGLVAALGVAAVTRAILRHLEALHIFGGLILLGLGLTMIRSQPDSAIRDTESSPAFVRSFLSAFLLMAANPIIIISFFGIFATLDLAAHHAGVFGSLRLGLGLFCGSSAWWLVYMLADWRAGRWLRQFGLRAINLGGGLLICGFGVWQLGVAFFAGR